ncbi:hypothetical protein DFH27DRAFT_287432 [Peziza echinospora]|nr:hypothetical protein DFH27DRAFT_287432 [Peziza echinospora]
MIDFPSLPSYLVYFCYYSAPIFFSFLWFLILNSHHTYTDHDNEQISNLIEKKKNTGTPYDIHIITNLLYTHSSSSIAIYILKLLLRFHLLSFFWNSLVFLVSLYLAYIVCRVSSIWVKWGSLGIFLSQICFVFVFLCFCGMWFVIFLTFFFPFLSFWSFMFISVMAVGWLVRPRREEEGT